MITQLRALKDSRTPFSVEKWETLCLGGGKRASLVLKLAAESADVERAVVSACQEYADRLADERVKFLDLSAEATARRKADERVAELTRRREQLEAERDELHSGVTAALTEGARDRAAPLVLKRALADEELTAVAGLLADAAAEARQARAALAEALGEHMAAAHRRERADAERAAETAKGALVSAVAGELFTRALATDAAVLALAGGLPAALTELAASE